MSRSAVAIILLMLASTWEVLEAGISEIRNPGGM